jgi:hypothetical protein
MKFGIDRTLARRLGQQLLAEVAGQLEKNNRRASGALIRSLEHREIIDGDGVGAIEILALPYWVFTNEGRGKTRKRGDGETLKKALERWVELKGISSPASSEFKSIVFLITRKINREGYKGDFGFDKALKSWGIKTAGEIETGIADVMRKRVVG